MKRSSECWCRKVNKSFLSSLDEVQKVIRYRARRRRKLGIPRKTFQREEVDAKKVFALFECKKCAEKKPRNEVYFRRMAGVLRIICRVCEMLGEKSDLNTFLRKKWNRMCGYVNGRNIYSKNLKGLRVSTKEDFIQAFRNDKTFLRMWNAWVRAKFFHALLPTVQRKDKGDGYVVGNIRWVTWQDHIAILKLNNSEKRKGKVAV